MNLAFFGTSDRSIPILEGLKKSELDLSLCVTKKDVKVGRRQKLKSTAVKSWAKDNGVHVVTADRLDPKSTSYIKKVLKEKSIDLCVVADFSFMIPAELFNFPKYKFVNIHFSLLPNYRGASPVQFSILNLDKVTGISYQVVVAGMDEGPIIAQTKYKLSENETAGEVYKKLFEVSGAELPEILNDYINGKLKPKEQQHADATYTYSPSKPKSTHIFKEDAKVNWEDSAQKIDAKVRAFNPWPVAWTTLTELAKHLNLKTNKKTGSMVVKIHKGKIKDNKYEILKLQPENKNKMSWDSFKNGYLSSTSEL